jgi:serine/threonine-protein kinase
MATVHLGCLRGAAGFSKLVAIKCLHQEFATEPSFVSMFLDEARLASSIHHPNVVSSLDVVAEQGELLVVMEYVHGETLAGLLRLARQAQERAPVPVAARVVCDALEGLHAAHTASLAGSSLNIVHRDVSPQNIMVGADGNTKVLDFGIAQAALTSHVTAAGTVKGKIAYMSPEQAQGLGVDARTDVFAAGVVLWEALTGRRLFFAPDARTSMELLLTSVVAPPSSLVPTLSSALDAVVLRALERDRDARFASAHDFAEALRAVVGEGSRREVAEWVTRVAKDGLAHRLELLQALEASAVHTQSDLWVAKVAQSSPRAAPVAASAEQTQAQVTVTTSVLPVPQRPRSFHGKAPWWAAALGVMTALGAVLWFLRAPLSDVPAPSARAASVAYAEPSIAPALPPVVTPTAAGAVSTSAPLPTAADLPPLETVEPPKTTAKKPPPRELSASTSTPIATPVKKGCSPPYRIDAAGVRRVKPECL